MPISYIKHSEANNKNGPYTNRLLSVNTNNNNNPLVTIQPDKNDPKLLHLKFIRTRKSKSKSKSKSSSSNGSNVDTPNYSFDYLLNDVICYAKNNSYKYVQLEDDSDFTVNDGTAEGCIFKSKYYRAFQNKKSIYVVRGFYSLERNDEIDDHLKNIYEYKVSDAKALCELLSDDLKTEIKNISVDLDNTRFGEWLLSKPCKFYRAIIIRLQELAAKYKIYKNSITSEIKNKIDKLFSTLSNNNKTFLTSYREYYSIHTDLVIDASTCKLDTTNTVSNGKSKKRIPYIRPFKSARTKSDPIRRITTNTTTLVPSRTRTRTLSRTRSEPIKRANSSVTSKSRKLASSSTLSHM